MPIHEAMAAQEGCRSVTTRQPDFGMPMGPWSLRMLALWRPRGKIIARACHAAPGLAGSNRWGAKARRKSGSGFYEWKMARP
jgi:hypothetical protein